MILNRKATGSTPVITAKTITQNGTYTAADEGADGFSPVTVNVTVPTAQYGILFDTVNAAGAPTKVTVRYPAGISFTGTPGGSATAGILSFNSALTTAVLAEGVTSVEAHAFRQCTALASLTIPSTLTAIGAYAFLGCTHVTALDLSETALTSIDTSAFQSSGLQSITLPAALSTVGSSAFRDTSLTVIDFPGNALNTIGASAFQNCSSLASLILHKTSGLVTLQASALAGTAIEEGDGYIYVPDSTVNFYRQADNWSAYADQILPLSSLDE